METFLQTKEGITAGIAAGAAIVAALVAAVASIVGPMVTTKISRRQTTATLRQKWIDQLRETISEFLSILNHYILLPKVPLDSEENRIRYERLVFLEVKIQLMLNRHEADHKNLITLMGKLLTIVHEDSIPQKDRIDQMTLHHRGFVQLSQDILKREWNRVKTD